MKDITALFEIFPICQKIILNTMDMKSLPVTKTQMFILFALLGKQPLNMSQISHYIASSKEQATRAVAPLVKEGYVIRFHNEADRKQIFICLTQKGEDFIQKEKELVKMRLSNHFNRLSPEDRLAFHTSLSETLSILKKLES